MDIISLGAAKTYASRRAQELELRLAQVNKELKDYQRTLAQMNPNQEPKQTVSDYEIVSLPKNAAEGHISVTAKGLTATNIINNGNFANGTSGWQGTNATISVSNNIMQVVADGSAYVGWLVQNTSYSIFPSRKYFIKAKLRVTNNDCDRMRVLIRNTGGSGDSAYTITAPVANQWYSLAIILDSQATHAGNFRLLFDHNYADAATANGKIMEVQEVMVIDLIAHGLESKTEEELDAMFPHYFEGTKSTISAMRLKSVSEDESEVSTVYVMAKDKDGKIAELRSLPNGTKDEIRVSGGKAELVKRVSDKLYLTPDDVISIYDAEDTLYAVASINLNLENAPTWTFNYEGKVYLENWIERQRYAYFNQIPEGYENSYYTRETNGLRICFPKGTTLEQAREQLAGTPLIYQLAEPVEIPIQTSGSLVSYPSGTVYIEPYVADAGIYTDKMEVLYSDLPIKALEKISKIDFDTGLETELDITAAVIAENKLSFTHPDLVDGDIVFFTYEYDRESTEGETEIKYYDSRYVIKDSVTGKFYKWQLAVADGVPSIKLTEV